MPPCVDIETGMYPRVSYCVFFWQNSFCCPDYWKHLFFLYLGFPCEYKCAEKINHPFRDEHARNVHYIVCDNNPEVPSGFQVLPVLFFIYWWSFLRSNKGFPCSTCGKKFVGNYKLQRHERGCRAKFKKRDQGYLLLLSCVAFRNLIQTHCIQWVVGGVANLHDIVYVGKPSTSWKLVKR